MPVDPVALAHFKSWDGEIGQSFRERIERYKDVVRVNIPYKTGDLQRSIDSVEVEGAGPDTLVALVGANPHGTDAGYAAIVHDGSVPHVIAPRFPRKSLKFKVAGRVVYARRVFHPGTQPDPYLERWLGEITG